MNDLVEDHSLLVSAVRDAGALAMQYFGTQPMAWQKKGGTPVSEADIAVNTLFRRQLAETRPDYGWLSEETEDDLTRLTRRRVWVVDPIDGTRAFLDGLPHFCHAVALVECGRPIMAALYNPALDEFYEASAGCGAKLNGSSIRVSARAEIATSRFKAECGTSRDARRDKGPSRTPEPDAITSLVGGCTWKSSLNTASW